MNYKKGDTLMNIYEEGVRLLEKQQSFVIASIISSTGSTPRSKGTQMIIREDGSIFGTVGVEKWKLLVQKRAQKQ